MSEYDKLANDLTSLIFRLNDKWSDLYKLLSLVQLLDMRPSPFVSGVIQSMKRLMDEMGAVVDAADDLNTEVNAGIMTAKEVLNAD